MNEPMSQEDFELACAECEGVKVSTIKAWRKSTGGYSNEKIDDMYLGYSLATVALEKQKAITRRVSAESNRLFDEKAVLIKQLEAAERERDELREWVKCVEAERDKAISWHSSLLKKHDKLQADIERRDAAAGETVALRWRFIPMYSDVPLMHWTYIDNPKFFPDIRAMEGAEIQEVFSVAPPAVPPDLEQDVKNIIGLLQENEWAEHCTKSELVRKLEGEITHLHDLCAQQQKVVELPAVRKSDDVVYGGSGAFTMGKNSGFNECLAIVTSSLDAANVKWEVKK